MLIFEQHTPAAPAYIRYHNNWEFLPHLTFGSSKALSLCSFSWDTSTGSLPGDVLWRLRKVLMWLVSSEWESGKSWRGNNRVSGQNTPQRTSSGKDFFSQMSKNLLQTVRNFQVTEPNDFMQSSFQHCWEMIHCSTAAPSKGNEPMWEARNPPNTCKGLYAKGCSSLTQGSGFHLLLIPLMGKQSLLQG